MSNKNVASAFVTFESERIEFRLQHSNRKTLAISVRPDMSVIVTAPHHADLDAVKSKVRKRAVWIRKQRRFFERFLPHVPPRRYISGETHRYLGRQYRLKIKQAAVESVKLKGRFLWVETLHKEDNDRIRKLVDAWYLAHARAAFARSLASGHLSMHGRIIERPPLHLRRMPKRWASWTQRGSIYLNPELVRAPWSCIDYVVTHELCHLIHAHHGSKFYALLRNIMPDWEARKARLEVAMTQ